MNKNRRRILNKKIRMLNSKRKIKINKKSRVMIKVNKKKREKNEFNIYI